MTEKVPREKIKREKGFLYFIGKDGYIWAAPMKHNKTGVKHKVGTQKVPLTEEEIAERKRKQEAASRPAPEPTPKKFSFLEWLLGKK